MVAGGMSKTNKIGLVGGFPIPEVNRLMHAFMAGAKEINPKAEFMVTFINSWFDPPKAKEAAFAMIDRGADVMYAERFGVSDAAKERGKLAIGNVIDRVVHGKVVDFLLAHWQDRWYFPAFNVADSAITVGAVLLVLDEVLRLGKSR
jgi:basic membrane lipoprotein Med (substrate-binding protein (PBP1-ABC) superfamily)